MPADGRKKIVLMAGSPSNKPGQHEYFAGCALMMHWLSQVPGVQPVMVADGWPKNEAVLDDAKAVVLYMDGGAKLPFLDAARWARMDKLAATGTGFVGLHQAIDCPVERAADFKKWFGAVWQADIGCRGHWDMKFDKIPPHAVTGGVEPFELLKDGWLYNLHYAGAGVTPVLAALVPEKTRTTEHARAHAGREETVAWTFERPGGGRSFGFTGCDLHSNWASEPQRRLVLNGILWSAGLPPLEDEKTPTIAEADLAKNLDRKIFTPKPKPAKTTKINAVSQ